MCDGSGACGNMINSKQHNKVLANGYEMIDGKKVVCNTKEKRDKLRHKLNSSKDVHTIGEKKTKMKHKQVCDGGYDKRTKTHQADSSKSGTNKLDRYRIPEELIFSLFQE
jgi:hypothetical protein